MSRINILNVTAEDFAIESLASAPTSGSAGDHEDGRIVKYGTSFYMWHDATGTWVRFASSTEYTSLETRLSQQEDGRATADSSLATADASLSTRIGVEEAARSTAVSSEAEARASEITSAETVRVAADASLELRLSQEEDAATSAVSSLNVRAAAAEAAVSAENASEISRASTAESSLETLISSEESSELSAETSLDARMSAQTSNRVAVVDSNNTVLGTAASDRASADSSLETRLSQEEVVVDAILNASTSDKDSFAEIVSFINATDVSEDSELSTEFSDLGSSLASAGVARADADSSLETRLSNEEDAEASAELSLNTRVSSEASAQAAADDSLSTRLSSEESARLAADNSIASDAGSAASDRASADTSIQTRLAAEESNELSAEVSLDTRVSVEASTQVVADASLSSRIAVEEAAKDTAISSLSDDVSSSVDTDENSSMASADASLELRLSTEESNMVVADASVTTRIAAEETARINADTSLETRLSNQEDAENTAVSSLSTLISSEASTMVVEDSTLKSTIDSQVSVVSSDLDAILDSADADKDTFVEIFTFLSGVDSTSDDALSTYVANIDTSLAEELSTMNSADTSLSTRIGDEETARASAVTSLETKHSALISSQNSSIVSLETKEAARHVRIDFTGQTSFTVAQADLPSGYTAGNGMVQIFHEVSSGTFRHLVAPATFNPSTGAMTFDLGSSAKDGFAVFYSFAGDEKSVSTPSNAAQFQMATSNSSYDANPPTELSETYAGASQQTYIYIIDIDNATYTIDNSGGYTSYNWTINNPLKSEYDSATNSYTYHLAWGNEGDTGAYIRWYSQMSTDGGTSWGSTQYTDTTVTLGEYGPSGTDSTDFPSSSNGIPAQGATVGAAFKIWAEGYDVNGACLFKAGSESAPYYVLDTDHDFQMYSGQHYTTTSIYWHASGSSGLPSVFGQQRDVTLTKPSTLNVGDNFSDSIAGFNANYNAYNYGWDSYSTNWALTGTHAAEFDIMPYTSGDQQSASNSGDVTLKFKENGDPYNRLVPASGTYTVRLTASNAGGADVIWDITVVI